MHAGPLLLIEPNGKPWELPLGMRREGVPCHSSFAGLNWIGLVRVPRDNGE